MILLWGDRIRPLSYIYIWYSCYLYYCAALSELKYF